MRRKLGCLAAVGAAVLLLAVLGLVEIDSPALGRALLARAGAATGATLEASELRLSLLRGVTLRNVRASGSLTGGRYDVALERLVFDASPCTACDSTVRGSACTRRPGRRSASAPRRPRPARGWPSR